MFQQLKFRAFPEMVDLSKKDGESYSPQYSLAQIDGDDDAAATIPPTHHSDSANNSAKQQQPQQQYQYADYDSGSFGWPSQPSHISPDSLPAAPAGSLYSENPLTVYDPILASVDGPISYGLPSTTIQVDDDLDTDSLYESDAMSETTSLRSAAMAYVYENGRRYHSYRAGSYWGPNDERAQDNLDLFHHVFSLSFEGALYLAPIGPSPQKVLDLGTGTGIWALDFADSCPSATVIGTDLSPVQPGDVPPNLEFQVDDFTQPWTFDPNTFDYIHARSIYGSIADYSAFYESVLTALKPGGWFEQAEISVVPLSDDGSTRGTYLDRWGPLAIKAGQAFGKSFSIAEDSYTLMREAGFTNITRKTFKWPVGPWPKELRLKEVGSYNRLGWEEGIDGWAMFLFTKFLGWRPEEVQILIANIKRELRDPNIHAYQYITVVYGQCPYYRR